MVEIITKCFSWFSHKYLRGTIKCPEHSLLWQNSTVKVSVSKTQTANVLTSMECRWRYCADQLFCPTVHLHQSPLESKIKKPLLYSSIWKWLLTDICLKRNKSHHYFFFKCNLNTMNRDLLLVWRRNSCTLSVPPPLPHPIPNPLFHCCCSFGPLSVSCRHGKGVEDATMTIINLIHTHLRKGKAHARFLLIFYQCSTLSLFTCG